MFVRYFGSNGLVALRGPTSYIIRAPVWAVPATAGAKYDPFGDVPKRGRGSARQIFGEPSVSSYWGAGRAPTFWRVSLGSPKTSESVWTIRKRISTALGV